MGCVSWRKRTDARRDSRPLSCLRALNLARSLHLRERHRRTMMQALEIICAVWVALALGMAGLVMRESWHRFH